MVAAGVVVAGCASVDGDPLATTTGPVITETSGNPWDLPIEQRPALFDPCAEIPVEAVEQGVGGPVAKAPQFSGHQTADLLSCGWKSDEMLVVVLATWKSHGEYLENPTGVIDSFDVEVAGRNALRLTDRPEDPNSCRYLFFTTSGTIAVSVALTTGLDTFRGKDFTAVCDALHEVSLPIAEFVPEGDFR